MWLSERQKFGVGFTVAGCIFLFFGIITFFDGALLALGNLVFIIGVTLIIGPHKTIAFFTRPSKIRGSFCFILGIVIILLKHPFIGFAIESIGILSLFGDFFSIIISFLRSMPIIGPILSHPAIAPTVDKLAGIRVLPV